MSIFDLNRKGMYDPLDYRLSDMNRLEPKKGRLLISDPFLPDPYFKRSVVLIADHTKEGSLGFILNKPLEISLNDTELKLDGLNHQMHFGGPVQSTDLFYIHRKGETIEGSTPIDAGVSWGGDFKIVETMLKDGTLTEKDIRFYVGYSGWEATQLEREISEDSWLVVEYDLKGIFTTHSENLWKDILGNMDDDLSILSTFPEDPNMN